MMLFIVLTLITWRVSSLLAREEGPWGMLDKLRYVVGVRTDGQETYGLHSLARGVLCMWCNSVWVGTLLAVGVYGWQAGLLLGLALSAGAIIIEERIVNYE